MRLTPTKVRNRLLSAGFKKALLGLRGFQCYQDRYEQEIVIVDYYIARAGLAIKDEDERMKNLVSYKAALINAGFVVDWTEYRTLHVRLPDPQKVL